MRSLPSPRGPITELLIGTLQDPPGTLEALEPARFGAPWLNEDLQLALYLCSEEEGLSLSSYIKPVLASG